VIEVELQGIDGLYCIVKESTGVQYTHQCGGYSCNQNSAEGFLVPLENSKEMEGKLYDYFFNDLKYKGGCDSGIDEDDAVYIESLLNSGREKWICVDRSLLKECKESWVYLKLKNGFPCFPFCYQSNPNSSIVLIWENSD